MSKFPNLKKAGIVLLIIPATLSLFTQHALAGIGDGPRAFQIGPVGATKIGITPTHKDSNFNIDGSRAEPAARIISDIVAFQYATVSKLNGQVVGLIVYAPFGKISKKSLETSKVAKSEGAGDLSLGIAIGLYGAPALKLKEFVRFKPSFSFGLTGKVILPTGEYNQDKFANLGSNRWSAKIGAALSWYFGESLLAGQNTSFELTPGVTFFGENSDPYEADSLKQTELYSLEANFTHDFSKRIWASIDALYLIGGATITDGIRADNETEKFALGGTLGVYISPGFTAQLGYGKTLKIDSDGYKDYSLRIKVSKAF